MPISDCQVRDPRIRRTRQLLQGALSTLMQSKSLEDISVQDISETATLNRATFYDHYTDKYALLEAMVAGGFHKLLNERQVHFDGTCPSAASAIILAVCDYLTQIQAQVNGANQSAFAPLVDAAILGAVCRIIGQGLPPAKSKTAVSPEVLAAAISWAIYGAVKQQFAKPKHAKTSRVLKQVLEVIQPMMRANESS